jgi:hypothetical protein
MTSLRALRPEDHRAIAMGLADGMLTALLLASGRLLGRGDPIDGGLALRVAVGAMATGAFIFYVGRYAELRGTLIRAEQQLNLTSRGKLATTRLGRAVLHEAVRDSAVSGVSSFAGALLALLLAVGLPSAPALARMIPVGMLAAMAPCSPAWSPDRLPCGRAAWSPVARPWRRSRGSSISSPEAHPPPEEDIEP